jgi:cold shock protein
MSRMQNRTDLPADINACERILALDDARLNLELSKAGLDPEGLGQRLDAGLVINTSSASADADAGQQDPQHGERRHQGPQPPSPATATHASSTSAAALIAATPALATFESSGRMRFFDARRGFGFFVADDGQGDVLVHIFHLRAAGYLTAYEGARVHALVHRTQKGLQVSRILSMDESSAVHPSQLPQRTREKVQPESDWVRASVNWYCCQRGFGFVSESDGAPDCLVHADTLRRWGVAPLRPKQAVEIRWGTTPKGRMVAEIRYLDSLPGLPPVH